jgi:hypothetical protein
MTRSPTGTLATVVATTTEVADTPRRANLLRHDELVLPPAFEPLYSFMATRP